MAILTTPDKDKIKRVIPKNTNKVIDATVARLYIAYPDPNQWQYTGLSGAIVLVDDLVGHTFFLKLVDLIGNKGVLWDQELYVDFQYNQDRSFFHSFEIDECNAGLLFEDKSDASHFFKRVTTKEKHGTKKTIQNKNAIALKKKPDEERKRGFRGDMSHSATGDITNEQRLRRAKGIIYYDDLPPPEWRTFYKELETMGINEEMIADNREFIKDYISQRGGPLVGLEPPIPRKYQFSSNSGAARQRSSTITSTNSLGSTPSGSTRRKKAPPPPPPPPSGSAPLSAPAIPLSNSSDEYDFAPPPEFNATSTTPSGPSRVASTASIPGTTSSSTTAQSSPGFGHLPAPTKHRVPPPPASFAAPPALPPKPTQSPFSPATPTQSPFSPTAVAPAPALPPGRGTVPALTARGNVSAPPARGFAPAPPARAPVLPPPPAHHSRGAVPPPPPSRHSAAPPAPPSRVSHSSVSRTAPAPPPPRRGPAPPPPPSRAAVARPTTLATPQQPVAPALPAYPTQVPYQQTTQQQQFSASPVQQQNFPPPPPPPVRNVVTSPPPTSFGQPPPPTSFGQPSLSPALQNSTAIQQEPVIPTYSNTAVAPSLSPQHQQQSSNIAQAPPPPPAFPTSNGGAPPAPPPPPMMPTSFSNLDAPSVEAPTGDLGRDALLSAIRGAGGIGSLKKVDKSQLEKPSITPKASSNTTGGANGGQTSLTDALNAALSSRKKKVSHYDDDDDDW